LTARRFRRRCLGEKRKQSIRQGRIHTEIRQEETLGLHPVYLLPSVHNLDRKVDFVALGVSPSTSNLNTKQRTTKGGELQAKNDNRNTLVEQRDNQVQRSCLHKYNDVVAYDENTGWDAGRRRGYQAVMSWKTWIWERFFCRVHRWLWKIQTVFLFLSFSLRALVEEIMGLIKNGILTVLTKRFSLLTISFQDSSFLRLLL
jgi:hypothetical protein